MGKVRRYEGTKVRRYEGTKVRRYESTKVRKYESTKVRKYESTDPLRTAPGGASKLAATKAESPANYAGLQLQDRPCRMESIPRPSVIPKEAPRIPCPCERPCAPTEE